MSYTVSNLLRLAPEWVQLEALTYHCEGPSVRP